jgi:tripartite-type tricarboxylate transporter receptor subunit TctC
VNIVRNVSMAAIATLALMASLQPLSAQDYPSRPVRVVVPFAAGAGTDLLGRLVAGELSQRLSQQFFVENKAGAAAQLGTDLVAKSPADGYTLLWTVSDGLSVLPAVKASVPYKIPDDFAFIAGVSQMPFVVSVNAKLPIKSMAELIAYAKANPGRLNFGSAGVGSAPHLGIALIGVAAGIDMVHVPFAGLGPATNALIAGTVDLALVTPPLIKPHADSGAVRAVAVTGKARHPLMPDVPTLQEAGLNVTTIVSYGLSAPTGTPERILAKLRNVMTEMIEDKTVVERLRVLGYQSDHLIGDAYRDFIVKDLEQWRAVAKAASIKIDN